MKTSFGLFLGKGNTERRVSDAKAPSLLKMGLLDVAGKEELVSPVGKLHRPLPNLNALMNSICL